MGGSPRVPGRFSKGEGSSPIQGAAPPESQDGWTDGGQPDAISQPVDPGGVGGLCCVVK